MKAMARTCLRIGMLLGMLVPALDVKAGTAQYRATFDATWSADSHPFDFPGEAAHFSGLIGGTHDANAQFWAPGELATRGIEVMAETGGKFFLMEEVEQAMAAGDAYSVISGSGLAPSPGSVSVTFDASSTHPLVTLVSMIAPSPDWFLGVHDLPLFEEGEWLDDIVVELWPYDAGTDSGATFTSLDIDTQPRIPISPITAFPFEGTPALGTFTFELLSSTPLIPGDANGDNLVDLNDFNALKANLGRENPRHGHGDFNDDNLVDLNDFNILKANFGAQASAVPEPATWLMAVLGFIPLLVAVLGGIKRLAMPPPEAENHGPPQYAVV